ncbi:MAG: hypothetical protein ACRDQ9_15205, partial [Pseudonocardiaceae bacterium]
MPWSAHHDGRKWPAASCPAATPGCHAQQRQARQAAAQAGLDALRAAPALGSAARDRDQDSGRGTGPGIAGADRELAEELMREVITILERSLGRREALRAARWALAALGLSG